jgi:hypothetical protein
MTMTAAASNAAASLIRADRKRANRNNLTIAVALDAIGERIIDRGLLGRRFQA